MSEEDKEFEMLKAKRLAEMQKNLSMQNQSDEKPKEENKKIERHTRCLKDTLKDGNGIDKDYCKYLLELERLNPR